jgi:hypothetical protein
VKVLLDENLDHALRKFLGRHKVVTVTYMGWAGLLTGDQTLGYEQNLTGRRLAIVTLSAIQLPILRNNVPKIISAIEGPYPAPFRR